MMEIGRICMKTAGRERGKVCVIVDILDENFVLIDGNVRRRRCNIDHLEPTPKKLDINKGARTETILKALKEAGYEIEPWKLRKKEKAKEPKKKEKPKAKKEEKKVKEKPKKKAKKKAKKKEEKPKKGKKKATGTGKAKKSKGRRKIKTKKG